MQLESITIIVSTVLSTMCHPVIFVFALLALQCITAQGNVVMFNKKSNTILLSLIAIIIHFHHVYSQHNDKRRRIFRCMPVRARTSVGYTPTQTHHNNNNNK